MILKIRCQTHLNICNECTFFSAADATKFHKPLVKCLSIGKVFQSNYHTSLVHFLSVFPNNKNNIQMTAFAKVTFYLNVPSLSACGKVKSDPSGHISLSLKILNCQYPNKIRSWKLLSIYYLSNNLLKHIKQLYKRCLQNQPDFFLIIQKRFHQTQALLKYNFLWNWERIRFRLILTKPIGTLGTMERASQHICF